MPKRIKIIIVLTTLLVIIIMAFLWILSYGSVWKNLPFDHIPQNDICNTDDDCFCRQTDVMDGCGEVGDDWQCKKNKCTYIPYSN